MIIALGVPETGKSSYVKRLVRDEPRLIVYDPNNEYRFQGCVVVQPHSDENDRLRNLRELLLATGAGRARIAYVSDDPTDFPMFCRLARAWAQPDRRDRGPCTVLIEELADVVPPGKAPRFLGMLLRGGRHRGIKVRAVGHSPKEIDKTTLRMATLWHIHTLGTPSDVEYLAKEIIGCDPAGMAGLPPYHYVEYKKFDPAKTPIHGTTSPI